MKGHVTKLGKDHFKIILELGLGPDGKRMRSVKTFHGGSREADREFTRLMRELDTGLLVDSGRMTVTEYLEKWLEHCQSNVRVRTAERYEGITRKHLMPALGHHRLAALRPMHISSYYTMALKSGRLKGHAGLSAQTVVHHHRVLHKAFAQAVQWQLIAVNPTAAVRPPKPAYVEMKFLTEKQTRDLLMATEGSELHLPTLVAVTTGLRLGELLGLHWRQVDLKKGVLSVTQSLQATRTGLQFFPPKTKRGSRSIPLTSSTTTALKALRKQQAGKKIAGQYNDNDLVFAREDGSIWNPRTFSSSWFRKRDALGLDIRFHDLRHTHATLLLRQGIHVKVVSERLGHSSVAITLDTYSHVLPDMQEEATEKLERVLSKAISG